jgi:hypothetical protein
VLGVVAFPVPHFVACPVFWPLFEAMPLGVTPLHVGWTAAAAHAHANANALRISPLTATAPPHSALSLEAELKRRELQAQIDALSRRQAAREQAGGKPGVGTREQLLARLRDLQRAKRVKQAMAAEGVGAASPGGSFSPLSPAAAAASSSAFASPASLHGHHAGGPPPSQEWREKLHTAKVKYLSSLDQMAPEWQANNQQRRMEQLAKYERAIGTQTRQQVCAVTTAARTQAMSQLFIFSCRVVCVVFCVSLQTLCWCVASNPLWPMPRSARCKRF